MAPSAPRLRSRSATRFAIARGLAPWLIPALLLAILTGGCAGQRPDRAKSPGEIALHLDLAESYMSQGELPRAMQELNFVAAHAAAEPRYHFDMGMAKFALGRHAEAETSFKEAVRLKADYGEAINNLGWTQYATGRHAEAAATFRRAAELLTYLTPERAWYGAALAERQLGRMPEAEKAARQGIARNWAYVPAYTVLNQILLDQGRLDEATDILRKGVEAAPDHPGVTLLLAESLMRQGQNDEARFWLERLAKQTPDAPEARTAKDYLDILH